MSVAEAEAIKAEGNVSFKAGDFAEALKLYRRALKTCPLEALPERATFLKNMAACQLKLKKYDDAVTSSTKALDIVPSDVKALWRRSQAFEALGKQEEAFKDMAQASRYEPKNAGFRREAQRLMQMVAPKLNKQRSSGGMAEKLLDVSLTAETEEKRLDGVKNCIAFAREGAGAEKLFKQGIVSRFLPLLDKEDAELRCAVLHTFRAVSTDNIPRALGVLASLTKPETAKKLQALVMSSEVKVVQAVVTILAGLLDTLTERFAASEAENRALDTLIDLLAGLVPNRTIIAEGRDRAITAIMKAAKSPGFARRLLDRGGLQKLLIAAALARSPLAETANDSGVATSADTRQHIAVTLSRLIEATTEKGKLDEKLLEQCTAQVQLGPDPLGNIPAVNVLTTIMQANIDMGNQMLETAGVFGALMAMAQSGNLDAQCASAEALAFAASDKKRCRGIMLEGFPILKRLYAKDLPDSIRVRALVGLCKMGAANQGAPNMKTFSEGSVVNLGKKLRPFLVAKSASEDVRRWAAEGIAFLSLDADVKELIIKDAHILAAVRLVCKGGDKTVQFALANMLVNITNSFDKPEKSEHAEQLKALGKYAGEHIPEPHPLDADEHVLRRVDILVKSSFVEAICELAKCDSEMAKEQCARVLLAMVMDPKHRGTVVAQGGARALLPLSREASEKGQSIAAQALAKIAITSNPSMSFPGQRSLELIKPLIKLGYKRNGLQQFEAGMALTNLASVSEDARNKIHREKGVQMLDSLMFDEDPLVRRCGTEALCNLFMSEKIWKMYAVKDGELFGRLKLWILLSGCEPVDEEEDEIDVPTVRAASGGLAQLSSSPDVCARIVEEKQGMQVLKELIVCSETDLQHRGLHILTNVASVDAAGELELAKAVAEPEMLMVLSALALTSNVEIVKNMAEGVLNILVKKGILGSLAEAHIRAQTYAKERANQPPPPPKEEEEEEGLELEQEQDEEKEVVIEADNQPFVTGIEEITEDVEEIVLETAPAGPKQSTV